MSSLSPGSASARARWFDIFDFLTRRSFFQLCVDWKKVSQSSIRKVFTMCKGFYAPTWLKLHSLKQDELFDLVKISRERDTEWQDKKDKDTGKMVKVKRDAPPTSRKLELEMDWLQKYVDVELTKRKKEQKLARGGHGQAKAPPQKKAKRNDKADPKASVSHPNYSSIKTYAEECLRRVLRKRNLLRPGKEKGRRK